MGRWIRQYFEKRKLASGQHSFYLTESNGQDWPTMRMRSRQSFLMSPPLFASLGRVQAISFLRQILRNERDLEAVRTGTADVTGHRSLFADV